MSSESASRPLALPARPSVSAALKEWAVVCKALEDGRQVLLLRKGGILEYRQGFEVKHHIFLLYPTYEHQSRDLIQADYADELDNILQNAPKMGKNRISSYAKVVKVEQVTNKSVLQKLHKFHIWNDQYVDARMNYNPKKPMHAILLRVFKMNKPFEVEVKAEWAGCKSWIPVESLMPDPNDDSIYNEHLSVLDNWKFNKTVAEIQEILT